MKKSSYTSVLILVICSMLILSIRQQAFAFNSYVYKAQKPEVHIFANQNVTVLREKPSQLVNLAKQLRDRNKTKILTFATIVLDELITLYHAEALRAKLTAMESSKDSDKLIRWSLKTLAFSNDLAAVRSQLSLLSNLQIHSEGFGELSIIIDGKPILVNSPLIRQQEAMEERIVAVTCSRISCDQKQLQEYYDRMEYRVVVDARWSLKEDGHTSYQTRSGLHFVFSDLENKREKERISRNVARDLNLIADSLVQVHKQGFFIDWEYLYLNSEGGSDQNYRLVINQFRDSISLQLLAIPYLNDYPQKVIPWLQARIKKQTAHYYIHDAEMVVSELSNFL